MEHATLYDVLTAWGPTVGFIVTALLAYWGKTKIAKVEAKVAEVHTVLNSRLSQLLDATEKAAHAAGEAAERARVAQELLKSKSEDG